MLLWAEIHRTLAFSSRRSHRQIFHNWNQFDGFISIILKLTRGVAWSSGQRWRLPLQGSRDRIPVVPLSFISWTYLQQTVVKKLWLQAVTRRKAGAAIEEEEGPAGVSGMDLREVVRFVSKTIKWLTPSKDWHGEKNITCYCQLV